MWVRARVQKTVGVKHARRYTHVSHTRELFGGCHRDAGMRQQPRVRGEVVDVTRMCTKKAAIAAWEQMLKWAHGVQLGVYACPSRIRPEALYRNSYVGV